MDSTEELVDKVDKFLNELADFGILEVIRSNSEFLEDVQTFIEGYKSVTKM